VLVDGFESNSAAQDDKSNKSNLNINRIQIFFSNTVCRFGKFSKILLMLRAQ
jgi:hypothetical protein